MLGRNRGLFVATLLGLVVFSLLAGFTLASLMGPQPERYPGYTETDSEQTGATGPVAAGQTKTLRYKQPCRSPESREESDLCAQWVAANSARDNLVWNERQFWIGVITAIGLGITIMLTFRAAKAAEDQLGHARKVASEEMRAYMSFGLLEIEQSSEDSWLVTVKALNHGSRNAYDVVVNMVIHVYDFPLPEVRSGKSIHSSPFPTVRPTGDATRQYPVNLSADEVSDIREARKAIWCRFTLSYRPTADGEPDGRTDERVFTGEDLDDKRARIIESWMFEPVEKNQEAQEHLPLPQPRP